MKKYWIQTFLSRLGWIIAGFVALGTILDAVSNAINVVTPIITYIGSVCLLTILLVGTFFIQDHPISWSFAGYQFNIKRIGAKVIFTLIGMLFLLWLPQIINANIFSQPDTSTIVSKQVSTPSPNLEAIKSPSPSKTSTFTPTTTKTPTISPTYTPEPTTLADAYGCDPENKMGTLLILANFDSSDSEKYRVTDLILNELNQAVSYFKDVEILTLNQHISESLGSEYARKVGQFCNADLVIWGWYGATETNALITAHVESYIPFSLIYPESANSYQLVAAISELQSFSLQTRLSKQLSAFTMFVSGYIEYSKGNYSQALLRLNQSAESDEWTSDIIGKEFIYFFQGNAFNSTNDYDAAIDSYTKSIEINEEFVDAYLNRGVVYGELGNLSAAFKDFSTAIKIKPNEPLSYYNRGLVPLHLNVV